MEKSDIWDEQLRQKYNSDDNCEPRGLLKNVNMSCYIDSALVALLFHPTKFVWDNILTKQVKDVLDVHGKPCKIKLIQDELKKLTKMLNTGSSKKNECKVTQLRTLLINHCNILNKTIKEMERETGDSMEFIDYLYEIFEIQSYLRSSTQLVYRHLILTLDVVTGKHPIQNMINGSRTNNNDIYYLDIKSNQNPIIFVNVAARQYIQPKSRPFFDLEPTIIFPLLNENRSVKYKLTRIIIHKPNHVILYMKCGDNWWVYNDMDKIYKKIGTFDIVKKNDIVQQHMQSLMYIPEDEPFYKKPISDIYITNDQHVGVDTLEDVFDGWTKGSKKVEYIELGPPYHELVQPIEQQFVQPIEQHETETEPTQLTKQDEINITKIAQKNNIGLTTKCWSSIKKWASLIGQRTQKKQGEKTDELIANLQNTCKHPDTSTPVKQKWIDFKENLHNYIIDKISKIKSKQITKEFQNNVIKNKIMVPDYGLISATGKPYTSSELDINTGVSPKLTGELVEIIHPAHDNIAFKQNNTINVYNFIKDLPIATIILVVNDYNNIKNNLKGLYLKIGRHVDDNRWVRLNQLYDYGTDGNVINELWIKNIGKFIIPFLNIVKN